MSLAHEDFYETSLKISIIETRCVALDISEAFAMVWHKHFLPKLASSRLTPKLCNWFESFLSNRNIKVVIDGISSSSV